MIQRRCFILFAWALLQCFGYAQAQQNSVAVTPASIDASVKRGASYTQTFTLTNNTETRLRFKCSVADVWYDDGNNRITGNPGYAAAFGLAVGAVPTCRCDCGTAKLDGSEGCDHRAPNSERELLHHADL